MGRLVHTGLGSSSLVAHVLHYPPPPHANSFVLGPAVIKHTQVELAAKEEKEHLANFTRKWEGLDPGADYEKDKAKHARMVKVAALGRNSEKSVYSDFTAQMSGN